MGRPSKIGTPAPPCKTCGGEQERRVRKCGTSYLFCNICNRRKAMFLRYEKMTFAELESHRIKLIDQHAMLIANIDKMLGDKYSALNPR